MPVGNPAKRLSVKDTSGSALTGNSVVTGTDVVSKGVKAGPYDQFGLWVDVSSAGGTNPTLTVKFEWSEDSTNGVDGTWAPLLESDQGSTTQSQLAITSVTGAFGAFFANPCSSRGWVRANFVSGGTSPDYDIDSNYWVFKNGASIGR